jgi:hypothetical protein
MASVTLAESAKLSQDMLLAGVIENVITVNKFFRVLPFQEIDGNALAYNRENALGDVQTAAVGDSITAKAAATFTAVTSPLTTIVGDAEVNGLIEATRSARTDQTAQQVASKAKSVGRKYQDMLVNGPGTGSTFTGLLTLVDSGQVLEAGAAAAAGAVLSFVDLDNLMDLVTAKDGEVDFITMHSRTHRAYMALLRGLGGASVNEVIDLGGGITVNAYRGVPIFRNDWLPTDQVKGASGAICTTVLAGTFDDGSGKVGITGITARNAAGIRVERVGVAEAKDETITRIKWYCGLACFSLKGLAALKNVTN